MVFKRMMGILAAMAAVVAIAVVAAALGGTANVGSSAAPAPVRAPSAAPAAPADDGGGVAGRARGGNLFAAIATNKNEKVWGYAWHFGSRANAESRALEECQTRSAVPADCRGTAWVRNGCVAVARVLRTDLTISQITWGIAAGCNNAQRNALGAATRPARVYEVVHAEDGSVR